jgi:hypothetical protein
MDFQSNRVEFIPKELILMLSKSLRPYLLIPIVVLLLCACQPGGNVTPTATALPLPALDPPIGHVFILSLDGLRPEAISQAPMPTLITLMQNGAYTLTAQTISPSSTLPSHTSMLTGLCPAPRGAMQMGPTCSTWRTLPAWIRS